MVARAERLARRFHRQGRLCHGNRKDNITAQVKHHFGLLRHLGQLISDDAMTSRSAAAS